MMQTYEAYLQIATFGLMYLLGLYLLQSLRKPFPVIMFTIAYVSLSYAGYLIHEIKGVVIAAMAVMILALLYLLHAINKQIDAAIQKAEEKERAAKNGTEIFTTKSKIEKV